MDYAFAFWKDHAVCTESSYPYTAQDGTCAETSCTVGVPKGSVIGYFDVPANDEEALMEAVAKQPVSVAIEADQMAFQMYSKGILTKKCGHNLDHGVLLVGYGTENGVDYWKVKNSWGRLGRRMMTVLRGHHNMNKIKKVMLPIVLRGNL